MSTRSSSKNRARLRFIAKAVVSFGVLIGILAYAGPRQVIAQIAAMPAWLVAAALGLLFTEALFRAVNWLQVVRAAGGNMKVGTAIYAYLVGGFFGALLPSTLGTDLARSAVGAARSATPLGVLLATTVRLNLISLAVIGATAVAAVGWLRSAGATLDRVVYASSAVGAACLLGIGMLGAWAARAPASRGAGTDGPTVRRGGLAGTLMRRSAGFLTALRSAPTAASLAPIVLVCTWSYLSRMLGLLLLLVAAGTPVPFFGLITIGPLLVLGGALPISFLGFGGYQAISLYLLAGWGVPAEQALAASLVQTGLAVLLYAVGCGVYLAGGKGRTSPFGPGGVDPTVPR